MQESQIECVDERAAIQESCKDGNAAISHHTFLIVRILVSTLLVISALVSFFPLRDHFSTSEAYAPLIQTLDKKKSNVLGFVAASTAASASISLIPGDAGTPLANKLMDLSTNFMIVLAIIYLEKYLLTVFGLVSFGGLIPIALICFVVALWLFGRSTWSEACRRLGSKLLVLAAVLMLAVPSSVYVTDMIDRTYEMSVTAPESAKGEVASKQEEGSGSILDFIASIPNKVVDSVTSITDDVLSQVNQLIEGAAVMIVTSCLIPILVLVFYLWVANTLLGMNVNAPKQYLVGRVQRMRSDKSEKDGHKTTSVTKA